MIRLTKLEGVEQELAKLTNIEKQLETGQVQAVLKTNGQRIIDSARNLAPHKRGTGKLRKSIGWVIKKDKQFRNSALIGIREGQAKKNRQNNPAIYGNILQADSISTKRRAVKFMQMALEINQNAVTEGIKKGLLNLITKNK